MNSKTIPLVSLKIDDKVYSYKIYESLKQLKKNKSQRKAAEKLGISHAVFNRRIKKVEKDLNLKLTEKKGQGSILTQEGEQILDIFEKYQKKINESENITIGGGYIISELLESIKTPFNIDIYSSSNKNAYKLAKKGSIDILALDDPLIAFEKDLNFTPIAFDHLVLITNKNVEKIKSMNDLENLDFIEVNGSAQRLAWNTLQHYDINYNIAYKVNSQFSAFKQIQNSNNIYSFLNASYFKGNNILKYDTRHVISLVQINEDKKEVNDFINYLTSNAQNEIKQQGFIPLQNPI